MYYKDPAASATGFFCRCALKCILWFKPAELKTGWPGPGNFPVESLFYFVRFFDTENIETLFGDSECKPSVMQGTCEKKLGYADGGNV